MRRGEQSRTRTWRTRVDSRPEGKELAEEPEGAWAEGLQENLAMETKGGQGWHSSQGLVAG